MWIIASWVIYNIYILKIQIRAISFIHLFNIVRNSSTYALTY